MVTCSACSFDCATNFEKPIGATVSLSSTACPSPALDLGRRSVSRSSSASLPSIVCDNPTDVIHGAGADTFQVLSVLGEGSFGTVYKVVEKLSGHSYAMKVLQKERYIEADRLRYAITEKNVQSSVVHPFIVGLVCAFQTDHELALVMPFHPGGTLAQLVGAQGRLSEKLSRLYFAEVFLAIEHLHSCDVAHRDLKCENVMVDDLGHAMLTDFGLSKRQRTGGRRRADSFVGSIGFMAPEVLAQHQHGKAVDVYGLGVVLFEMLTGAPPFSARCAKEIVHNIQNAELEIPSFVSGDCAAILRALLHRVPESRLGASNTPDIRSHPFLASTDFDAVLRRKAVMPLPSQRSSDQKPASATQLPEPFQTGWTFLSLLGGATVQDWEYPAPAAVVATQPQAPPASRVPPAPQVRGWHIDDLIPMAQMPVVF